MVRMSAHPAGERICSRPTLVMEYARDERMEEPDRLGDVAAVARMLQTPVLVGGSLPGLLRFSTQPILPMSMHERALAQIATCPASRPRRIAADRTVGGARLGVTGCVPVHLVDRLVRDLRSSAGTSRRILVEPRVLDGSSRARADEQGRLCAGLLAEARAAREARGGDPARDAAASIFSGTDGARPGAFNPSRRSASRCRVRSRAASSRRRALRHEGVRLNALEREAAGRACRRCSCQSACLSVLHRARAKGASAGRGAGARSSRPRRCRATSTRIAVDLVDRRVADGREHLSSSERRRDAHLGRGRAPPSAEVLRDEALLSRAALDDVNDLFDLEGLEDVVVRRRASSRRSRSRPCRTRSRSR